MPVSSKRKKTKAVKNKRILTKRTSSWTIIKEARTSIEMISRAVAGVATVMRDADTLNIPDAARVACTDALRTLGTVLVWSHEPTVTLLMRAEEIYSRAVGIVEQSPYIKESQLHDSVNEMYGVLHRSVQPVLEPFAVLCDTLLEVDNLTDEHTRVLNTSIQMMKSSHLPTINPAAVAGG
jgi:hypothetical protein